MQEIPDGAHARLLRIEARRGWGLVVATARRFAAIRGFDLAGLLSLELFLTLVPITVMVFVLSTVAGPDGLNPGSLYVRQLRLSGEDAQLMLDTFGDSHALREEVSTWWGALSFLGWGIPMSLTLADTFAKAWRRPASPSRRLQLARGTAWFGLFLACTFASEALVVVSLRHLPGAGLVADLLAHLVGALPLVVLWTLTPMLLVNGTHWKWRVLVPVGVAAALLNGPLFQLVEVLLFPGLVWWYSGMGPLSVAMAMLTWAGIQATGWVLVACLGGVMQERREAAAGSPAQSLPAPSSSST